MKINVTNYTAKLTHSNRSSIVTVVKEIETENLGFIVFIREDGSKGLASESMSTWEPCEEPSIFLSFWVWWKSRWQGIRLKPGEEITLDVRESTEEGWSSLTETYKAADDGRSVTCVSVSDGRDCDGRLMESDTYICACENLEAGTALDGTKIASWINIESIQRDYLAEEMNY